MADIKFIIILSVNLFCMVGCNQVVKIENDKSIKVTNAIRYHISLERQNSVYLSSSDNLSSEPQKMTENLNLFLSCQPIESDDRDVTSYKLTFSSIQAKKADFIQTGRPTDSAMGLTGKSFIVSVTNDGIISSPQLEQELKLLSNNSFEDVKRPGVRLKYPDFLQDMWSVQALLLESTIAGKDIDKSGFQACQQLPWPIADIAGPVVLTTWQREKNVNSLSSTAESVLTDISPLNALPALYSGPFKMEGLLGYLRGCKYESADVKTTCKINPMDGLPDELVRQTEVRASAYYLLSNNNKPVTITVKETLSIQRQ